MFERWFTSSGTLDAEEQAARDQHNLDNSRLGMDPIKRVMLAAGMSMAVGASLGLSHGSTVSGMRFRAEHAHKLPSTPTGWFMYHKSKNYTMARAGLKEGFKMGLKISIVTSSIFVIEGLYDEYRQTKDFINTTLASVTVAGGFSLWSRFNLPTAARATKTALIVGLAYGGLQDVAGALRGRPIGYIDWTRKKLGFGIREDEDEGHQQSAAP